MKKTLIPALLSFVIFISLMSCKTNIPLTTSDEDLYKELKEPLIGTIMYNGTTRHPDGDEGQLFLYTFNGYMTNLPYKITMSRNVSFEDCAGCIGDWKTGMLSNPQYNDTGFISLKEFIIQMVHSNDENTAPLNGKEVTAYHTWQTGDFIWKVTPTDEDNTYIIEVASLSDREKKWVVRV